MILAWIILSFVVAFIGSDRKIGYWGTFFLSLLLSPIIGAIFALASQRKAQVTKETEPKEVYRMYKLARKEFYNNDFNRAVLFLEDALKFSPNSKLILFNLSVCYSALKNKEKGFYYLERAVKNGYSNFKKIQEDYSLKFLRNQPEYKEFATNGYKLISSKIPKDTVGKLEKLAELKEKGILTNDEFETQKKKILSANKGNYI